jgi:cytochrome c553
MKKLTFAVCILLTTHTIGYATTTAPASAGLVGNAEEGKTKSTNLACVGCHGPDGNSLGPTFPNLAGQHASYIVRQLQAFKSGARSEPSMTPMAMPLTEQDIVDLAAYFSSQTVKMSSASEDSVKSGQKIYRGGNKKTGLPACAGCHGPQGLGNPAANYPALSSQHKEYTVKQLKDYQSGARKPEGNAAIMRDIAIKMSEDEMKVVTDYMQGLH